MNRVILTVLEVWADPTWLLHNLHHSPATGSGGSTLAHYHSTGNKNLICNHSVILNICGLVSLQAKAKEKRYYPDRLPDLSVPLPAGLTSSKENLT